MTSASNHKVVSIALLTAVWFFLGLGQGWSQTINVWPGDVNENGKVNHVDLLYLGLRLGSQGPARDSISIEWLGQSAMKWGPTTNTAPDAVHADCNGDSTVDLNDRIAIDLNYGWDRGLNIPDSSSLKSSGSSTAVPLSLIFSGNPLVAGTSDTIFFQLGSDAQPVDSMLGFATTITFDSSLVDSAYLFTTGSWLGTEGVDLTTIENYEAGKLEVALTRTDRNDKVQEGGPLGGIVVVMTDNLKQEVQVDSLDFQFEDALGMTSGFNIVEIEVGNTQAPIFAPTQALDALIYPNPSTSDVNISLLTQELEGPVQGELYNRQGARIMEFSVEAGEPYRLKRNGLGSGIYLLKLSTAESHFHHRIVLID